MPYFTLFSSQNSFGNDTSSLTLQSICAAQSASGTMTTIFQFIPILVLLVQVSTERDKNIYCGSCLVLVDEMQWSIGQEDPKKTIEVGSFRVDPQGNQKLSQISYARSEIHLTELLERICEKMKDYAETTDDDTGKVTYMRTSSRDGSGVSLSNVRMSADIQRYLKNACETIIEEHEEEFLLHFRNKDADVENVMCVKETGLCQEDDIGVFKRVKNRKPPPPEPSESEDVQTEPDVTSTNDGHQGASETTETESDIPKIPDNAKIVSPQSDQDSNTEKNEL